MSPKTHIDPDKNIAQEGKKQGTNPQRDTYQDVLNDEGQEIEHELTAEEESEKDDIDQSLKDWKPY